jgi:hypothetical protein
VIESANTERGKLLDLGADHVASLWYQLGFPQTYVSTRYVQGHEIVVVVANGEMAKRIMDAAERRTRRRGGDAE